jgi:hypothetical protein
MLASISPSGLYYQHWNNEHRKRWLKQKRISAQRKTKQLNPTGKAYPVPHKKWSTLSESERHKLYP